MDPWLVTDKATIWHGDCLDVLRSLPDASVDAVVTDPPYGLEFMGKAWDSFTDADVSAGGRWDTERRADPSDSLTAEKMRGRGPSYGARTYTNECVKCGRRDGFAGNIRKPHAGCDSMDWRRIPVHAGAAPQMLAFGAWCTLWAAECLRVLKPGGHMLAFGGTRTWHRLACAVEDAGFEIRDSIAWMYGSGFPKSLDVSKAIDKDNGRKFEDRFALGRHIRARREALGLTPADVNGWFGYRDGCQHWERQDRSGARVPTLADWHILRDRLDLDDEHLPLVERVEAEREVVGRAIGAANGSVVGLGSGRSMASEYDATIPATPDAERWQGWGTALKPAFEPIVVARKPLTGTVAATVLAHGTGALNIDGTRIGREEGDRTDYGLSNGAAAGIGYHGLDGRTPYDGSAGRWPANVVLDEEMARRLDQQSGELHGSGNKGDTGNGTDGDYDASSFHVSYAGRANRDYGSDGGGASRFVYVAKADTNERVRVNGTSHPTVKPLALMRWLIRLVTPPGGTVLEPFAGSGTTVEAALLEGFRCIAIEREADYLPLIRQRIDRRTDPVAAVRATGEQDTLFDLLGEEPL